MRLQSQGWCFLVTWVHCVYITLHVNQRNKHKFCKALQINNQWEATGISEETWIFWILFLRYCSQYRWCQSFSFYSTWLCLKLLRPLSSRCNIDIGQLLEWHGCLATGPTLEPDMTVTTGVWEGTDKTVPVPHPHTHQHTHPHTHSDISACVLLSGKGD